MRYFRGKFVSTRNTSKVVRGKWAYWDRGKLRGISFLETALAASFSKMLRINELKYEAVVFNEGHGHNYTIANVPEAFLYNCEKEELFYITETRESIAPSLAPLHRIYENRKCIRKSYDWKRLVSCRFFSQNFSHVKYCIWEKNRVYKNQQIFYESFTNIHHEKEAIHFLIKGKC